LITTLNALAAVHIGAKRWSAAEEVIERAERLANDSLGPLDEQASMIRLNRAMLCVGKRDYVAAAKHFKQLTAQLDTQNESSRSIAHGATVLYRTMLARIPRQARDSLQRALAIETR
jgi:hypothetical protein